MDLYDLAPRALGRHYDGWYRDAPHWTGGAPLRGDLLPALATFADPADPGSVRLLRPDAFEAVFGPGYRFVGASLEMADAGVWPLNLLGLSGEASTRGIEQRLPWLGQPLPWLSPVGSGVFADRRTSPFILQVEHVRRGRAP
jgi:hypothetical protein